MTDLPRMPPRSVDSHKGTYGRVLVVAGRRGMTGAAILAGTAALRSGAGLVTVACPDSILDTVAAGFPCYTTFPLKVNPTGELSSAAADALVYLATEFDVVAVGPGLGTSDAVALLVHAVLTRVTKPVVLDADGLNVLNAESLAKRTATTILTPHPGEFSRLTQQPSPKSEAERVVAAQAFAQRHSCVVVLKGHRSVVTDGTRHRLNATGNPGMATGGTGDVLTGVIAALVGQGFPVYDAAVLAAHVHGLAGDLAARELGQISLTAMDLLTHLPTAFVDVSASVS